MCARFTVLSDTPIAAAIAGCTIPLSRNSTIWMRWRCAAGIFHRSAVLSRRTSALLHLTICLPRIKWRKRITHRVRKPTVCGGNMRCEDGCREQWKRRRLVPGTRRPYIAALQACSMRGQYDLYQPEDDAEGEHLEFKCHCCPTVDLRRE